MRRWTGPFGWSPRGQVEGSPEADVHVYYSRVGTYHLIIVRRVPSYGDRHVVAQLGMSLPGSVAQLRMSLWNLEIGVCTMILEWVLSSSEHRQNGSNPIGDELFGR